MSRRRIRSVAVAVLIALPWAGAATPALAADSGTSIQFLVDASAGMGAADKAGRPKVESAREAVGAATKQLAGGVKASLRVYGAQSAVQDPKNPSASACDDSQLVASPSGGSHQKVTDALKKYAAKGYAPVLAGVKAADRDLGNAGNRHIVLVSSGAFACVPNPCADIGQLRAAGMTTPIDVVGIATDKDGAKQLACIAAVTGGTYLEAGDTAQTTNALERAVTRAMRGRDFFGTDIKGSDSPTGGDALGAGAYADVVELKKPRYYKLTVPAGGSVVVSASVRPAVSSSYNNNDLQVDLLGNDDTCATGRSTSTASLSTSGGYVTAAAAYDLIDTGRNSSSSRSCQGLTQVVAKVTWSGGDQTPPTPMQLVVSQVAGLSEPLGDVPGLSGKGYVKLPAPADTSSSNTAYPLPAPTDPRTTVVGGSGFPTAVELEPGSSKDVLPLGDLAYYKVKLDFGQSATLWVDSPGSKPFDASIMAYGPRRGALDSAWSGGALEDGATLGDGQKDHLAAYIAPVRANNVFSSYQKLYVANEPGYYYFAVRIGPTYDGVPYPGSVPLRLTLDVSGKAGDGRPAGFTASDNPGVTDPAVGSLGRSVLERVLTPGVLGFGIAGLGLIAAGVVTLIRRPA